MDQSVYLEKNISQQPALDLLQSMGYTYISATEKPYEKKGLFGFLKK